MINLEDTSSVYSVADWVELNVLFSEESLSKAKIISMVSQNGLDDEELDEDGYPISESFAFIDSVLQELDRRISVYGNNPPFNIVNNVIIPSVNWKQVPELAMCLLLSYFTAYNQHLGSKLFERLSGEVLMSYLGGKAITLGFPSEESLTEKLDKLAHELNETRGSRNPSSSDKDRGVDVVGWKSFGDSRNGQIVVLMQCAAGQTWERKKSIPLTAWAQYINWNYTTTIQCMSVTEIIRDDRWQNRTDEYGFLFDRARIYQCLYFTNYSLDLSLRNEISEWCLNRIAS